MAEFAAESVELVLAALKAGEGELASALSRALDNSFTMNTSGAGPCDPAQLSGPGLVAVLRVGDRGAAVVLSDSSGLLPSWVAAPDVTGKSKLATLAQELGMLVVPEPFLSDDQQAARVVDVAAALQRGALASDALDVSCPLKAADGRSATLHVIWPLHTCADVLREPPEPVTKPTPQAAPATPPQPKVIHTVGQSTPRPRAAGELPPYTRSLLRILVPVTVTLAKKRQLVSRIVDLGVGSIIHFDKSCEEMLDLEIGDESIAQGEPVKVGDRFGIRITGLHMPPERFKSVQELS